VGEDRDRIFAILETEADPRLIRHHDLRYREWCLRDGMEVVVRGRVKGRVAIPGERSSYREEASGPRLVGSAQDPIVLSDRGDL